MSEAFGAAGVLQSQSGITMNLRLPGQYFDEETNSHYNFHRDYRPNQGRYLQSDPMRLNAGINFYIYVGGNPVFRKDSYGLFSSGADFALVKHFYEQSGDYKNISAWCPDYLSAKQVKSAIEILKKDIMIQNKKLVELKGSITYQIKNNKHIYIDPMAIYSFGAGNGHMQDADCEAIGDGCCVRSECSLTVKAFDRFTDPLDLCQKFRACGSMREVGACHLISDCLVQLKDIASRIARRIVVKIRCGLLCITGTVVTVLFYELVRSIFYYLMDTAPEMGIVYPVILSPIISVPLGLVVFLFGWLFSFVFKLSLKTQSWFFLGCVFALVLPLLEIINLTRRMNIGS